MKNKEVVIIGGGTGTYTALKGLKKYPLDLTAIVSMTDSGGSNRIVRDEFGLLPTSDLRQCIVALASENSNGTLRDLFTYRYSKGVGISGMTFGNLFIAALSDIHNSQEKAIEETCKILQVQGSVLPVTYDNTNLVAEYANGLKVLGERYIDSPETDIGKFKIKKLSVFPKAKTTKKVLAAIKNADAIILGPGDLFTSIICNLVVSGVANAIKKSKARKIFVVNLMTRFGQTNNFTASDHVKELEKYLGKNSLDIALVNKNNIPAKAVKYYQQESVTPVKDDLKGTRNLQVARENIISKSFYKVPKGDVLKRSFIRHDSEKLAKALVKLI